MLRCISVFFVVFICWACEVDYSFGEKDFKPRVVVNALISPQEPFAVRLHWSRSYSAQSGFTPVGEAEIRLYEDNTEVVRCPADPEGTTQTTFRAAAGRSYRLVVSVPGYGELSARTTIPEAPAARISFAHQKGWYRHFDMTDLTAGVDAKAIWLRGTERDNNGEKDIYAFYTTSVFVDQVNGANDAYESDEKGSTIDFEYFLRVARENLGAAFPLRFSVFGAVENRHTFQIIAASDTYDRYMRSRYKHELNTGESAQENPFIEQITVYSNIDNGIGINQDILKKRSKRHVGLNIMSERAQRIGAKVTVGTVAPEVFQSGTCVELVISDQAQEDRSSLRTSAAAASGD